MIGTGSHIAIRGLILAEGFVVIRGPGINCVTGDLGGIILRIRVSDSSDLAKNRLPASMQATVAI
jgi:hypothetical protein